MELREDWLDSKSSLGRQFLDQMFSRVLTSKAAKKKKRKITFAQSLGNILVKSKSKILKKTAVASETHFTGRLDKSDVAEFRREVKRIQEEIREDFAVIDLSQIRTLKTRSKTGEIVGTLKKRLLKTVGDGEIAGDTKEQIGKRIEEVTKNYKKKPGFSAERIAEDGVMTVTRTMEYRTAELVDTRYADPTLEKTWISKGDGKVRTSHDLLHKTTVAMNDNFSNGLQYPHDPKGSAGEKIGCRCGLSYKGKLRKPING